ncbi:MAG TPA: hypothetical protein G4N92_08120 [Anaerolineae bacterium]|nr:hypothetical protein [Anaerolineae bacterium]
MINKDNAQVHNSIRRMLHDSRSILLVSHIRPDGDAVGSLIGMGLTLKAKGKQIQMVLMDGLPKNYRFLKGSESIVQEIKDNYDLSIILDSSDLRRIGSLFKGRMPDINIDHHITNERYARINLVDPKAAATAAMLAEHLPQWGYDLNPSVANAFLMGIITDTIGFSTINTSSKVLRLAADLMEQGADITDIYRKALSDHTMQACLLWGFALSRLHKEDQLIYTSIMLEDRRKAGYHGKDDADLTNVLSSIADCDISILFNEQSPKNVKVSWRSRTKLDVAKIAQQFGGGGHPAAAGAELQLDIIIAQEKVLQATHLFIEQNL